VVRRYPIREAAPEAPLAPKAEPEAPGARRRVGSDDEDLPIFARRRLGIWSDEADDADAAMSPATPAEDVVFGGQRLGMAAVVTPPGAADTNLDVGSEVGHVRDVRCER